MPTAAPLHLRRRTPAANGPATQHTPKHDSSTMVPRESSRSPRRWRRVSGHTPVFQPMMTCVLAAFSRGAARLAGRVEHHRAFAGFARVTYGVQSCSGSSSELRVVRSRLLGAASTGSSSGSAPSAGGQQARHSSLGDRADRSDVELCGNIRSATLRGDRLLGAAHGIHELQYCCAQSIFGVNIGCHRDRRDVRRDQVEPGTRPG